MVECFPPLLFSSSKFARNPTLSPSLSIIIIISLLARLPGEDEATASTMVICCKQRAYSRNWACFIYRIIENQKNHKGHVLLYPSCVFVCTPKEAYVYRIRPSATTRGGHRSWMPERGMGRPLVQRTINPSIRTAATSNARRRQWWSFRSSSSAAVTD